MNTLQIGYCGLKCQLYFTGYEILQTGAVVTYGSGPHSSSVTIKQPWT